MTFHTRSGGAAISTVISKRRDGSTWTRRFVRLITADCGLTKGRQSAEAQHARVQRRQFAGQQSYARAPSSDRRPPRCSSQPSTNITPPTTRKNVAADISVGKELRHMLLVRVKIAMMRMVTANERNIPPTPISPAERNDRIDCWLDRAKDNWFYRAGVITMFRYSIGP